MPKSLFLLLLISSVTWANTLIECRVVTEGFHECDPYTSKYFYAKEIEYDEDSKKLISVKSLPYLEKSPSVKVVSVKEIAEKYILPNESLRFKGSDSIPLDLIRIDEIKEIVTKDKKPVVRKPVLRSKEELDQYILELDEYAKVLQELEKSEEKQRFGIYKVVHGDTLSGIAKMFKMKITELRVLNRLKKGSLLRVGKRLTIPLSQEMIDTVSTAQYKIKQGDTLISIAKKFDLLPKELKKFNKLKNGTSLKVGKVLELPLPHRLAEQASQKKYSRYGKKSMRVTATAYTSHVAQTDSTPFLAAWNNRLIPGMKIIAVSRDLLSAYGMRNGTKVRIAGLPGIYRVRDKMNKRYRKRIDIYMGLDRKRALRWGRRSVKIYWD